MSSCDLCCCRLGRGPAAPDLLRAWTQRSCLHTHLSSLGCSMQWLRLQEPNIVVAILLPAQFVPGICAVSWSPNQLVCIQLCRAASFGLFPTQTDKRESTIPQSHLQWLYYNLCWNCTQAFAYCTPHFEGHLGEISVMLLCQSAAGICRGSVRTRTIRITIQQSLQCSPLLSRLNWSYSATRDLMRTNGPCHEHSRQLLGNATSFPDIQCTSQQSAGSKALKCIW